MGVRLNVRIISGTVLPSVGDKMIIISKPHVWLVAGCCTIWALTAAAIPEQNSADRAALSVQAVTQSDGALTAQDLSRIASAQDNVARCKQNLARAGN